MTYESIKDYNGYEIATLLAAMAIREGLKADDMKGWADTIWSWYWDMYDSADDNPTMMRNYKRTLDAYRYMEDYETIKFYIELDDPEYNYSNWHEFYFYMKVTKMMEKLDEEDKAEEESEEESDNKEDKDMTIEIELDEFQEAIREINSQAYEKFGNDIEIVIDTFNIDGPIMARVSWASIGSQSIEDAAEFARKLKEATEMAAAFVYNGAIYKWDEETNEGWYELEKKPSDDDNAEAESDEEEEYETEPMDFWDLMMKRTEDDRREYEQFKAKRAREREAATNLYDQIYAKIMDDNGQDEGGR